MKLFLFPLFCFVLFCAFADGQSRRATGQVPANTEANERTVRQMFDEVNEYNRVKFAEYQEKKVPYSEQLRIKTENERKQLAAKYAAIASARTLTDTEETYFIGMLHWVAENMDGTAAALIRYLAADGTEAARRQNARAVLVFVYSKQGKTDAAISRLGEYENTEPVKMSEIWRMNAEVAKAFLAKKEFAKAETNASAAYTAAKKLILDPASNINPLDAALDSGMLLFEARNLSGKTSEADAALDDMRQTAAKIKNHSFYFYAADKLIKHRIETGRKPLAMETYLESLIQAGKDIPAADGLNESIQRLKNRKKHYDLLGEPAPELIGVDKWFPGKTQTLGSMKGKVILLDFWATWCGPCFDAFPHLREWNADLSDNGLVILGVTRYYGRANGLTVDESNEIIFLERFREKHALPYDFVVSKDQKLQQLYGASNLPTAALIDRRGRVRYLETGSSPSRLEEMRSMVLKLLDER